MTKEESPPRVCPECGADRWKMRDATRLVEANLRLNEQVERLAARNGVLSHQLEVIALEHREHFSRGARKIARQARVIRRLEAKLREHGVPPYQGAPIDQTSTGAEYDTRVGEA
jgi:hypothetical protein